VRTASRNACAPLAIEDFGLQAAEFTSPPKWHLAHTTWFFETFVLEPFADGYTPVDPTFRVLFNSYYNGIGEQHPRDRRGLLSRPTVAEVMAYRDRVDAAVLELLDGACEAVNERVMLGLHHEQQHQELFYTDLQFSLFQNPLYPAYLENAPPTGTTAAAAPQWLAQPGGEVWIGRDEDRAFAFDNEGPRHRVLLGDYALRSHPVSNGEFQQFIDDGGYRTPELWLADGWTACQRGSWQAPLYWLGDGRRFSLYGPRDIDASAPVAHVSFYEADAFARWAGARLPTEFEWEAAARGDLEGTDGMESGHLLPGADGADGTGLRQLCGAVWQWTSSAYAPYPGFRASSGAIGEYNGKFMCNQQVLRGSSCVTAAGHARLSYRNFFYPQERWQFSGLRLARDS
jgi:ergothioneine biosynthesis protein EgtB